MAEKRRTQETACLRAAASNRRQHQEQTRAAASATLATRALPSARGALAGAPSTNRQWRPLPLQRFRNPGKRLANQGHGLGRRENPQDSAALRRCRHRGAQLRMAWRGNRARIPRRRWREPQRSGPPTEPESTSASTWPKQFTLSRDNLDQHRYGSCRAKEANQANRPMAWQIQGHVPLKTSSLGGFVCSGRPLGQPMGRGGGGLPRTRPSRQTSSQAV